MIMSLDDAVTASSSLCAVHKYAAACREAAASNTCGQDLALCIYLSCSKPHDFMVVVLSPLLLLLL
jgi:hypothetical protein